MKYSSKLILALTLMPYLTFGATVKEASVKIGFDELTDSRITLFGSKIDSTGDSPALRTGKNQYAVVDTKRRVSADGGAIALWVKPLWDSKDRRSHTLVSMPWTISKNEYLVISQGFYKKKSLRDIYFVVNNRHVSCSSSYQLPPDRWSHIIASWGQGGKNATCRIFINGSKVGERVKRMSRDYSANGRFFLGTDLGAANQANRSALTLIDDFKIYSNEITDDEAWLVFSKEIAESKRNGTLSSSTRRYPWADKIRSKYPDAAVPTTSQGRAIEPRTVLDPSIDWAESKRKSEDLIVWTKSAGFNVIVTPVWQGRGVRYLHEGVPVEKRVRHRLSRDDDPLSYLLQRAHEEGLEVHAWFNVVQRRGEILREFYDNGTPASAFDVHNSEFRDFIVSLMVDVARRYEVDGINLDHIRSMGICSSGPCEKDYKLRFGHSIQVDKLAWRVSKKAASRIAKWNYDSVTDIVRRVATQVREIKPGVSISVDAHPLHEGLLLQGQDSVRWANEGIVDRIFDMDYKTNPDYEMVERIKSALLDPQKLTVLYSTYDTTGKGLMPRPPGLLSIYVEMSRRLLPGSGAAFYHRNQITPEQISELRQGPFRISPIERCPGSSILTPQRPTATCR